MDRQQKINATAFIPRGSKALVIKRSDKEVFLPGYWELPGGKVDFGETLEEAVVREIGEETGLKIKPGKIYSSFSYITNNGLWHVIDAMFVCSIEDNNDLVKLSDAHSDFKWVDLAEIEGLQMSDEIKIEINKGFEAVSML
jgi:8-oxo-dGTP diphosphatase